MRINFSPNLQYGPGPFTPGIGGFGGAAGGAASKALGATPWGAIGQAALGLGQGIAGFIQQRRALKQLENIKSPTYTQSAGILDYYNKALAKYNVNPYQTDLYRMQEQQAGRGVASGLSALQSRGQALAGVNSLIQQRNDTLLKAGAQAENLSRQDLSRLGQAAGLKSGEEKMAFNINQMQPFQRKYSLLSQKASGGANIANAGISNIFGGLQSADQYRMINKIYGQ